MAKPFLDSFPLPKVEEEVDNGQNIDLNMLWQVLERHKQVMREKEEAGVNIGKTWELVVVQGVILTVLLLIALMWAFCCRKKCFSRPDSVTVAEALRKVSKDLPPSYSTRDLHTLGISVGDHLHPPPAYLDLFRDDLQYLDLEAGSARMAKLSFCGESGLLAGRVGRVSVASCASCNTDSPVIVAMEGTQDTKAPSNPSSRRPSRTSSRTSSRVSFSEDVECSNGSIRRLSASSTPSRKGSSSSSSSSDGSRKSSLSSRVAGVARKLGSQSSVAGETFASQLDEELRSKLEGLGEPEVAGERSAEEQARRAATVCDITTIQEEK